MPESKCGSWAGYRAHGKRGEPACDVCKAAVAAVQRERREAARAEGRDAVARVAGAVSAADAFECSIREAMGVASAACGEARAEFVSSLSTQWQVAAESLHKRKFDVDLRGELEANLRVVQGVVNAGPEMRYLSQLLRRVVRLTEALHAIDVKARKGSGGDAIHDKLAAGREARERRRLERGRAAGA